MANGAICVNTLKKDWTADTTFSHVLSVIRCLLIVPFPESSLNDEAGKLFMESYQEYAKRAKLMADIHGRSIMLDATKGEKSAEEENEGCRPANTIPSAGDRSLKAVNRSSSSTNPVKVVDKTKKKSLRRL